MARRIPENRFDELIRGATSVFIERGWRRTQMADVAAAIGVAKGTLYGYVDGKDALFLLCLVHADEPTPIALPEELPVPNPEPGELGRRVKDQLAQTATLHRLEAALETERAPDAAAEARAVVGELFDLMHTHRHGIKLLDRCMDHPELESLWQRQGREHTRTVMVRYLTQRSASGDFRDFENVRVAARFVIESCATWAVHIHWDKAPEPFDPKEARDGVIEAVVRGLIA